MDGKNELLAPAGEIAGVIGAINAGADAVYLGAPLFSARAYAKNLSVEEILDMINYAHLFHRKIYLALNIILKNREMKEVIDLLSPLYEAGLDAVIVQDLGLLSILSNYFPKMELHASTQMAIMSKASIELLKQYNVTRIVPARELSINEISQLKLSGLELECFIHGAMCYSYSGRCFMSSLAGGRSGNRGRCAGTCRQLYHTNQCKECYLLSMKDMCSINQIGNLIDLGIDSFKIEGRMKAPEYTAGVTAIYRKYIDIYKQTGKCNVSKDDLESLKDLYIRSEIQEGYYNKHNGKDMISFQSPSYRKISDQKRNQIHNKYIQDRRKMQIDITINVACNKKFETEIFANNITNTTYGDIVESATKRPISTEEIEKQFRKIGNTNFTIRKLKISNDNASFIPVSALNEYRRNAIKELESKLIPKKRIGKPFPLVNSETYSPKKETFRIGVLSEEQLELCLSYSFYDGIIVPMSLINKDNVDKLKAHKKKIFLRLPDIIREKHRVEIQETAKMLYDMFLLNGIYCNCLDAIAVGLSITTQEHIIADYGNLVMNEWTESTLLQKVSAYTASVEQNGKELSHAKYKNCREMVIYGRIPVMYSANCIINTTSGCDKTIDWVTLYDEKNHSFPTVLRHKYCYNTVYNCVPLSLHNQIEFLIKNKEASVYRIEFSMENVSECEKIMEYYADNHRNVEELVLKDYTNGHYNRGVL